MILEDYRNVVDEGFVASKIIHRIIFEGSFVFIIGFWNPFLLQKGSKPPQMRLTIKAFRLLRKASKSFALLKPTTF